MNPIVATWPLLLGMGILMLGAGLQGTLLGVRASIEQFGTPVTGLIMSCYYVGYLVGTRIAPRMLKRVGPVRVFATLAALASVAALVHGTWVHPLPWALMRGTAGVCFAGIYVVAESWLNHRASRSNRGALLAVYMLVLYVGLGSAQYLLVLASPQSDELFMLVSALISLAMVPIVATAEQTPQPAAPRRVHYRELYRNSPLGVVAVAISGMISSIIFGMGPVYAHLTGYGTRGVAEFMAVTIYAAVLTQYPVGRLSDRVDRRTVIASVCALATVAAGTLVAFGPHLPRPVFLALAGLFSGSALTLYSLSVSHVNDQLEPAQMVAASSALLRINGLAAAAGPALAGSLMAVFGRGAYFGTLAALTGVLTLYDLWRKARRRAVPHAPKAPFINAQQIVTCAGLEPPPGAASPGAVLPGAVLPGAASPVPPTPSRGSTAAPSSP